MNNTNIVFIGISVSFWQLVSLSVFGYAIAFLFWPKDVNKLFTESLPENVVRFIGVTLLFVDAGFNQMIENFNTTRPIVRQMAYISSMIQYVCAGVAGLVVVTLKPSIFIKEQRITFQVLFSLFIATLVFRVCGGIYIVNRRNPRLSTTQLQTVRVYKVQQQPVHSQGSQFSNKTIKSIKNGR